MPTPRRLLFLLLASLGLISCGGSGAPPADGGGTGAQLTAADEARTLAYFKSLLQGERAAASSPGGAGPGTAPTAGAPGVPADAPAAESFSRTTVQEAGVDEDDLVKTDGRKRRSRAQASAPRADPAG